MVRNFYYNTLVMICSIKYGNSVPIDYCLHPLDKGDCNVKPTPVFSYYKPGSRCEIEIWRGCPTFNKFSDEFLCSHYCIGKLWDGADFSSDLELINESVEIDEYDKCQTPMNEDDCGETGEFKYTFIGLICIRVPWKGCNSPNLFDDEETCINTCIKKSEEKIKKVLDNLPMDDVKAINKILDNVMVENGTEGMKENLLLEIKRTTKAETTLTTKATTEAMTEVVQTTSGATEMNSDYSTATKNVTAKVVSDSSEEDSSGPIENVKIFG